jgi:AcrR family transcriptional regulator
VAFAPSFAIHCVYVKAQCIVRFGAYTDAVPKLWNDTIEAHRREVRDAVLETTASLVAKHGLRSVTMSQIAEQTGIGRATLYKYFPDVEAILVAWHEEQIAAHLEQLAEIRGRSGSPGTRLRAVLEAYAWIRQEHHDAELARLLHRGDPMTHAEHRLRDLLAGLLAECAAAGEVRDDVSPQELATYCFHALGAAGGLQSKAAVRRLIAVTLDALRPAR